MSVRRSVSLPLAGRLLLLAVSLFLFLILNAIGVGAQTADDHGNFLNNATNLPLGSSVAGRIDPGNDVDVFKLDLSGRSGTTDVWIYTTGTTDDFDAWGTLHDSFGRTLIYNDDALISPNSFDFHLRRKLSSGIYYVGVRSIDDATGDYTLHAEAVTDPGSTIGTATRLNIDTLTAGSIDTASDADYFRIDLDTNTNLILYGRGLILRNRSGDLLPLEPFEGKVFDATNSPVSVNVFSAGLLGFTIRDDFGPGTYYIRVTTPPDADSYPVPYTIHSLEDNAYTNFINNCESAARPSQIDDPLYGCQWHLNNALGEDINVEPVWSDGFKGEGINIAVVDDGMDWSHEDLVDNVNPSLNHDYYGNGDIHDPFKHHGTNVAGIIAARDNGGGVRGVAPRATIYGYNLIFTEFTDLDSANAMTRNGVTTAVSNNSWGNPDSPGLNAVSSFWELAVKQGLSTGYGGKGIFYAWAGGNGHLKGDYSNLDEYNSYFGVTTVCAVNSGDTRSAYSEMGANLWVCAPSDDDGDEFRGIVTIENSDRYRDDFGGTSAATPIVSGVAALMRQANPNLTWRDLKLILAASARKNDPTNAGWKDGAFRYGSTSAADRYHFNHEYGFGVVDAKAAVDMAKGWTNTPPLKSAGAGFTSSTTIPAPGPSGPTTVTAGLTLSTDIEFIEFVEINADFEHTSFRDMEIELVSPSGAISKLTVQFNTRTDEDDSLDFVRLDGEFRFGSARHLGENPNGNWQLHLTDHYPIYGGTLRSWSIKVYGHSGTPVDTTACATGGAVTNASSNPGLVSDCETLLEARDTLVGTGTSLNWSPNTPITSWDGITLEGTPARVTQLSLWNRGFRGTIPSHLGNLSALTVLDLSTPTCGGAPCTNVQDHQRNQLRGTIPTALGDLTSLQVLNLHNNQLTGGIPLGLARLANLRVLALGLNQLSGTIPTQLSSLSSLTELYLWGNQLTGAIPTQLGNLFNLQELYLGENQLTGQLPTQLSNLSNLTRLSLSKNQLTGAIPTQLGSLSNLKVLSLWDNQLTGAIPASLSRLANLETLYLSQNQLTECIPAGLRGVAENDLDALMLPYCDVVLSRLTIDPGSLTPAFDPYHTDYTAVASATTVTLTPTSAHNATFEFLDVNDSAIADADANLAGHQITLAAQGVTTVKIRVTSQDGAASHTYAIQISMVSASGAMATRSFSTPAVAAGGQLVVTIEANNFGSFGGVTETLPTGFSYVASSLPVDLVVATGQEVRFTLFGESNFTYTVTASNTAGSYSFSGVLKDSTGIDYQVAGPSVITVGDAPGVAVSHVTPGAIPQVRINSPIPVTATFSEPVTGFAVSDITVTNGFAGNFVGNDSDSVYTFDVTPNAIGDVTVDIATDVALDAENNGNTAAIQLSLGIPYDDDHDGRINRDEVITAIGDYLFGGSLTRDQVIAIIGLYLFG